jgi:hypothetical protein
MRYFDGANWGPTAPPPTGPPAEPLLVPPPPPNSQPLTAQPKKQFGKKPLLILLGVLAFFGLVSQCDGGDKKADSRSSSSSSSVSTSPPKSSTSQTPTGPIKPDASFTTVQGPAGQEVTAKFAISDNLTEGFIKNGARFKTIEILKYAKATYPGASQVTVQGSFPMKDAYGNTSTDVVVNLTYLKSTIDKINFDGVDKDTIWELSDSGFIAPAFRP